MVAVPPFKTGVNKRTDPKSERTCVDAPYSHPRSARPLSRAKRHSDKLTRFPELTALIVGFRSALRQAFLFHFQCPGFLPVREPTERLVLVLNDCAANGTGSTSGRIQETALDQSGSTVN